MNAESERTEHGSGSESGEPARAEPPSGAREAAPISAAERVELLDVLRGFALFGRAARQHGVLQLVRLLHVGGRVAVALDGHRRSRRNVRDLRFRIPEVHHPVLDPVRARLLRSARPGTGQGWLRRPRCSSAGSPSLFAIRTGARVPRVDGRHPGHLRCDRARPARVPPSVLPAPSVCGARSRAGGTITVVAAFLGLAAWIGYEQSPEDKAEMVRLAEEATAVYATGSWGEIFLQRAREVGIAYVLVALTAPYILGMFLLGLLLGKTKILHESERHRPLFRRLLALGAIGAAINVARGRLRGLGQGAQRHARRHARSRRPPLHTRHDARLRIGPGAPLPSASGSGASCGSWHRSDAWPSRTT